MSIILRSVSSAQVRQQQLAGIYPTETIKPIQRTFVTSEPLNGTIRVIESSESVVKIYRPKSTGKCMWCRVDVPLDENIGIPINLEYTDGIMNIQVVGTTCCFEHSAALILRSQNWNVNYRTTMERNSWYICNLLYKMMYPDKKLLPAPDYQLIINNTPKALADANSKFIQLPNVKITQTDYEYQISQLKSN